MMKDQVLLWIILLLLHASGIHSSYSCSLDNNVEFKSRSLIKSTIDNYSIFLQAPEEYSKKYGSFSESQRLEMKEEARKMFQFGYDNYLKYAFPKDELNPIFCTGRGPDYENP